MEWKEIVAEVAEKAKKYHGGVKRLCVATGAGSSKIANWKSGLNEPTDKIKVKFLKDSKRILETLYNEKHHQIEQIAELAGDIEELGVNNQE